jgi:hypothetical protein
LPAASGAGGYPAWQDFRLGKLCLIRKLGNRSEICRGGRRKSGKLGTQAGMGI